MKLRLFRPIDHLRYVRVLPVDNWPVSRKVSSRSLRDCHVLGHISDAGQVLSLVYLVVAGQSPSHLDGIDPDPSTFNDPHGGLVVVARTLSADHCEPYTFDAESVAEVEWKHRFGDYKHWQFITRSGKLIAARAARSAPWFTRVRRRVVGFLMRTLWRLWK